MSMGALALAYVVSPLSAFAQMTFSTSTDSQDALLNTVAQQGGDRLLHILALILPVGLAFWGIYRVWRYGWGALFGRVTG